MKELREHNENMLRNILPSHVARHFLEKDRDNEVSWASLTMGRAGGGCCPVATLVSCSGALHHLHCVQENGEEPTPLVPGSPNWLTP